METCCVPQCLHRAPSDIFHAKSALSCVHRTAVPSCVHQFHEINKAGKHACHHPESGCGLSVLLSFVYQGLAGTGAGESLYLYESIRKDCLLKHSQHNFEIYRILCMIVRYSDRLISLISLLETGVFRKNDPPSHFKYIFKRSENVIQNIKPIDISTFCTCTCPW